MCFHFVIFTLLCNSYYYYFLKLLLPVPYPSLMFSPPAMKLAIKLALNDDWGDININTCCSGTRKEMFSNPAEWINHRIALPYLTRWSLVDGVMSSTQRQTVAWWKWCFTSSAGQRKPAAVDCRWAEGWKPQLLITSLEYLHRSHI